MAEWNSEGVLSVLLWHTKLKLLQMLALTLTLSTQMLMQHCWGEVEIKSENYFGLFPNPANSSVNLLFSASGNKVVSIPDLSGESEIVAEQINSLKIELSDFDTGIYTAAVKDDLAISSKKLVVHK